MKRNVFILMMAILIFSSCAPVLNKELMREGTRNISFPELLANPDQYTGKLFILGGIIVDTKFTQKGSQIEALYVPVDSRGYLQEDGKYSGGRFLAFYPKSRGLLDPMIYKKNREITLAGTFLTIQKSKIDEMEYSYPVFEIRQLYLWEEQQYYLGPAYPYPWYPYPYGWYDPWWPYPPYWYGPPPYGPRVW
jgi:outer membrane lipoprotein